MQRGSSLEQPTHYSALGSLAKYSNIYTKPLPSTDVSHRKRPTPTYSKAGVKSALGSYTP